MCSGLTGKQKERLEEEGDLLVENFNHSTTKGQSWRPYHSGSEASDSEEEQDEAEEEEEEEEDYEVDRLGNRIEKTNL